MRDSYDPREELEKLMRFVSGFPQQVRFDRTGHKLTSEPPSSFELICYCRALLVGALPEAKTRMFIASAFDRHIRAEGDLTLDVLFDLKLIRGVGNPSRALPRSAISEMKSYSKWHGCAQ